MADQRYLRSHRELMKTSRAKMADSFRQRRSLVFLGNTMAHTHTH